jgi:hypothetical protein
MVALIETPSSLRVRKLDPWVIQTHKRIAQGASTSLEDYLRNLLTQQALQAQHDFADVMEQHLAAMQAEGAIDFPSSESLIQAVREDSCS